jgi:ubiquinone/menaquinone biosynthesis C-methylase UbiE
VAVAVLVAEAPLPLRERLAEEVVDNRLGSGVHRRWVESLPLQGDERVLDIGTGAGACARHLARALPLGLLTCVDVDARWLEIARHRLARYAERVEFVEADICLWCRKGSFDVVTVHFVLYGIDPDRRASAVRGIADSLRAGGALYIREPIQHGLDADDLAWDLMRAGLERSIDDRVEEVPTMGATVNAAWRKPVVAGARFGATAGSTGP